MKINFFLSLVVFLFQFSNSFPQKRNDDFIILSYNVENLFDTKDEPNKEDDEFTPDGARHWTNKKLNQKLINISKVIINSSGWSMPGLIALYEVENQGVLEKLIKETPLKSANYKIIHKESPDHRGIDVALLYDPKLVYPLEYKFYPLQNEEGIIETREILYFSGLVNKKDTLHIFVNHWPSRYDGLLETKSMRNLAAMLLRSKVEDLQKRFDDPKIIIIGDFNDQPLDESISDVLCAKPFHEIPDKGQLYNLSLPWMKNDIGTIKYQSQWSVFDQCIVSGTLINSGKGYSVLSENVNIVELPFLLDKDERYGGLKPFRTYNGYSYQGGFSDHLPIKIRLTVKN